MTSNLRKLRASAWSRSELESSQVKLGLRLLRATGWTCYNLSDRRRANLTPGVPDLVAFHPVRGILFWEAKGMTGWGQSKRQKEFQAHCILARMPYVVGTFADLRIWLDGIGTNALTTIPLHSRPLNSLYKRDDR